MIKIKPTLLVRTFVVFFLASYHAEVFCAVDQILSDNFFMNPAELNLINKLQLIGGGVIINPSFFFRGNSYEQYGMAKSDATDFLPYLLSAYRCNEEIVFGINVTPSAYGHLNWATNSIVAQSSTLTKLLYYRYGIQTSYQLTESLAIGAGLNLEDNAQYKLNFVVPGQGNQINSVRALNYTYDLGLYYKINSKNYLPIAGYSSVSSTGYGTSSTSEITNNNFSLNVLEAPVVYLGLRNILNEKWTMTEKVYWSGFSVQKNIVFNNSTSGSYTIPTNWKDVWSFQATTRYAIKEKLALLGSIIYETNPVPLATNAIGYPLAASGSLSGGVDIALRKNLSIQVIYSYGAFLPNSPINNANIVGTINAHFQAGVLQLVYKT